MASKANSSTLPARTRASHNLDSVLDKTRTRLALVPPPANVQVLLTIRPARTKATLRASSLDNNRPPNLVNNLDSSRLNIALLNRTRPALATVTVATLNNTALPTAPPNKANTDKVDSPNTVHRAKDKVVNKEANMDNRADSSSLAMVRAGSRSTDKVVNMDSIAVSTRRRSPTATRAEATRSMDSALAKASPDNRDSRVVRKLSTSCANWARSFPRLVVSFKTLNFKLIHR